MIMPLNPDHMITEPYTLTAGKLTFRTGNLVLAQEARQAMTSRRNFTVWLLRPENREMTGKVVSVELLAGIKPTQLEIVMRV
jgi:hypothetical protein